MKTFKLLLFLCAVIINFTACETQETNTLTEEEQKSWETKVQNYLPFIYNNYTIGDSLIFVTENGEIVCFEVTEKYIMAPTSNEDGEMKDDEEDGTDEDDEDFENDEDYENDKRVNIQKQKNEEKSYLIHLGLTKDYYHHISIAIHVYLEKNTLGLIKITKKKEPSTQIIDANLEINNDLIKIEDSETTPYCTLKRNIGIIEIIDNDGNKCLLKEHKKNSK